MRAYKVVRHGTAAAAPLGARRPYGQRDADDASLTTGSSAWEPFSLTFDSPTLAVVGKYKRLNVLQDS